MPQPTPAADTEAQLETYRRIFALIPQSRRNLRAAKEIVTRLFRDRRDPCCIAFKDGTPQNLKPELEELYSSRAQARLLINQFGGILEDSELTNELAEDMRWLLDHHEKAYSYFFSIKSVFGAGSGYTKLLRQSWVQIRNMYPRLRERATSLEITQGIYQVMHNEPLKVVTRRRKLASTARSDKDNHHQSEAEGGESSTSAPHASGRNAVNHSLGRGDYRREQGGSLASRRLGRAEQAYGVNVFEPVSRRL